MSLLKNNLLCFLLLYIFLNIISLPMMLLMGDFKDGFIAIQQNFLIIAITILFLIFVFRVLKIKKVRFAIVIAFLIQYIIVFEGKIDFSDPLIIDGFFISSYLLNPLSFYIFKLLHIMNILGFLLLKIFPALSSFNMLIIVILVIIFNIFCWYYLGLLIERLLLRLIRK